LTKYIEEHNFNFDNCFDSDADNERVSNLSIFTANNGKETVFSHNPVDGF